MLLKYLPILIIFNEVHGQVASGKLKWLPAKDTDFKKLEPGGYLPSQDKLIWVGRSLFKKGLLVGYLDGPEKLHFHFNETKSTSGNDAKEDIQVLTFPPGSVSWQPKKTGDGVIPVNMVLGGVYPDREHIFVCRGFYETNLLIGYYRLMHDTCVVSFKSKGLSLTKFQVLQLNFYGMTSGVGAD